MIGAGKKSAVCGKAVMCGPGNLQKLSCLRGFQNTISHNSCQLRCGCHMLLPNCLPLFICPFHRSVQSVWRHEEGLGQSQLFPLHIALLS